MELMTDSSGFYSALWRPYHFIGLELAQSIYSIALKTTYWLYKILQS